MREFGGILSILAAIALVGMYFREFSYRRGFKDGYESGRESEENWWLSAAEEVDQERVKIWREEQ